MVVGNTYRVAVDENTDFSQSWKDPAVPFMEWVLNEESLDECEEENGVYYATYTTWDITVPRIATYMNSSGIETTITIPVGEYGIRS
tara:strand:- start:2127 stop:2387 length:261 start_codon:yes stop_codon:yes gene_type:complete